MVNNNNNNSSSNKDIYIKNIEKSTIQ